VGTTISSPSHKIKISACGSLYEWPTSNSPRTQGFAIRPAELVSPSIRSPAYCHRIIRMKSKVAIPLRRRRHGRAFGMVQRFFFFQEIRSGRQELPEIGAYGFDPGSQPGTMIGLKRIQIDPLDLTCWNGSRTCEIKEVF